MSSPYVSVVIDTYNYGQFVEQAVEGALAQEFPREKYEILVVDDGSTDDTPKRMEKYGEAIRYLRKPNGGQASAFNFGFAAARGEILATLDADDVWLPSKLRRVWDTFEKNPEAGMVYHRTYFWRGGEQTEADSHFVEASGCIPESRASLLRYPMIATSCLAFRRDALEKLLPVPEELRSQADAYLTALVIFVAQVVGVPEFLAKYRLHGANLFQFDGNSAAARGAIEHRMEMRIILQKKVREWLEAKKYDVESRDLRAYLKQWTKAQELDAFALQKPGRWKYFRHLFEFPRIYGEIMSPRHRLYSYVRAFGALILGYDRLPLLDDLRSRYKGLGSKAVHALNSSPSKESPLKG